MAGGESRRFGRPKAFATWRDSRFYERAVTALESVCDEVVLSVREDQLNDFPDFTGKLVTDLTPYQSRGPLGGLYALMSQTDADILVTLPCDMPIFQKEDTKRMLSAFGKHQALVPSVNGRLQPLSAIYSYSCLPVVKAQLEAGNFRMRSFYDQIDWIDMPHTELQISEEAFSNINDQEAYRQLLQHAQRRTTDGTD
ncbi:hypothetical protein JMA_06740 [Jeotgalibacillus malaysiensis]|uniref:MobA-like NTP transferase domain-containing protein n=1 Tax=Jeotgalibacillus malaysiensis TaxID=1508404 RepID=A0A0B5AIT9_9BACL|nr:hypothetical protein JMA_06740 [Jeotgalibacillus malaysiensis]